MNARFGHQRLFFPAKVNDKHLYDAIHDALLHDIVVVAAASNDGLDLDKEEIYSREVQSSEPSHRFGVDPHDALWTTRKLGEEDGAFRGASARDVISIWREGPGGYDTGSGTSDAAAIASARWPPALGGSGAYGRAGRADPQPDGCAVRRLRRQFEDGRR